MFKLINIIIQQDNFYGESKAIDEVKGVNRYPDTLRQAMKIAIRKIMCNSDKENC